MKIGKDQNVSTGNIIAYFQLIGLARELRIKRLQFPCKSLKNT
jgi:hypothetical protein